MCVQFSPKDNTVHLSVPQSELVKQSNRTSYLPYDLRRSTRKKFRYIQQEVLGAHNHSGQKKNKEGCKMFFLRNWNKDSDQEPIRPSTPFSAQLNNAKGKVKQGQTYMTASLSYTLSFQLLAAQMTSFSLLIIHFNFKFNV